jgi:hypothetical protein
MEYIEIFFKDFKNFLNPDATYSTTYSFLVVAVFSFLSSFVGLLLSWQIYKKYDKNLFDINTFTIRTILVESICAVLTTTILFVLKIVLLNVYSVFFFSLFWAKVFMKVVGHGEKSIETSLKEYNNKAGNSDTSQTYIE